MIPHHYSSIEPISNAPHATQPHSIPPTLSEQPNSISIAILPPLDIDNCHDAFEIIWDPHETLDPSVFYMDQLETISTYKYKKVANRVRPVATTLPEQFRIVRRIPHDVLADLPQLPTHPPVITPGKRYTAERMANQKINPTGFLLPEEEKLCQWIFRTHEDAFAWTEAEKGRLSNAYFDPIVIPTIEHIPWAMKNIPIPPGIFDEVVKIIKEKIASGAYEESSSSYRSQWFCVLKKDGKSLRIVHDLQPLNRVTIKDAAVPPLLETYAESFGGRACYGMFDLFVGYDQRELDERSRDLTTFQTPLGAQRLTVMPMGYTNAVQTFHGDITFILRPEIPHITRPYIDDIPGKGPPTRYETPDGGYEVIPENTGIRRFVWEHLVNMNRLIHRIRKAGGTFSGKKSDLCIPEVIIVGHRCTYEGRKADEMRIQKIRDWPICQNVSDVRGFLGTAGVVRMFIKNFAIHASPLIQLTKKGIEFKFGEEEKKAMRTIKHLIVTSPAIRPIDYTSDREVILAVDSSWRAVGFVLSQLGSDGKRYPSRFGSITWNEREQRYSQSKIELYGLFRALRNVRIYIIGVKNFAVEVDAKYIKGMINNPDFQPNATINRWIAGILLFDFKLRHVPGKEHSPADGLSRRSEAPEDQPEPDEDYDEWIDKSYGFAIEILNKSHTSLSGSPETPSFTLHTSRVPTLRSTQNFRPRPSFFVFNLIAETIELPHSNEARRRNKELTEIEDFLTTTNRPSHMNEEQFRRFVKKASGFFVLEGRLWKRDSHGKHKLVIPLTKRLGLIRDAHDSLGHKGMFSVRTRLLDRFWWPLLDQDVKWYIRTCHECQVRLLTKIHIPPSVPTPASLFRKVYIDTFLMPRAGGYRYVVHARCSLSSYPEWRMLRRETGNTIGAFIFQEILCRWGAVEEIQTDNGTPFVKALDYLAKTYGIHHIRISPYNSQAQGPVERRHFDVRESLIKAADGNENRWHEVAHSVLWAERVTTQKSTGYSPYYIAHGIEPLFPFDLAEATYMAPTPSKLMTTQDLLVARAVQLQRRASELENVKRRLIAARWASVRQFEKSVRSSIIDYNFAPGSLVLVRNSSVEASLDKKTKPRYFGPMVVIRRSTGGSYILGESDGTLSKLRFAAFRLLPYHTRSHIKIPSEAFKSISGDDLDALTHDSPHDEKDITPSNSK